MKFLKLIVSGYVPAGESLEETLEHCGFRQEPLEEKLQGGLWQETIPGDIKRTLILTISKEDEAVPGEIPGTISNKKGDNAGNQSGG